MAQSTTERAERRRRITVTCKILAFKKALFWHNKKFDISCGKKWEYIDLELPYFILTVLQPLVLISVLFQSFSIRTLCVYTIPDYIFQRYPTSASQPFPVRKRQWNEKCYCETFQQGMRGCSSRKMRWAAQWCAHWLAQLFRFTFPDRYVLSVLCPHRASNKGPCTTMLCSSRENDTTHAWASALSSPPTASTQASWLHEEAQSSNICISWGLITLSSYKHTW